jgi:hypothetical protein
MPKYLHALDTTLTHRWITAAAYAEIYSLTEQTLANWRYQDRQAGRHEARPGYPRYRYFGSAVRYEIEIPASDGAAA